jgi:hypothetical protein
MRPASQTSSAVILVRVWLEDGEFLRARIIESLDLINRGDESVLVVGSAAEIEHRVQDWLERLSRSGNAAVTSG